MATARQGDLVQSKIQALLFGKKFTGKSTLALQLMYFKRSDGKPFRVLALDPESGGMDDLMDDLVENNIDLKNLYIVYTQSLTEVREYIQKAKDKEDFYVLDEEGNETENIVLDADGQPFRPDAIIVDGTSVLNMTTKHGFVDLSKKRARVKADRDGIVGEEKFVKVESAFLELKDYNIINFKGQDLVLDLTACGLHYVITARETDEKVTKEINGKEVTVATGEKIPEGFKEMDYNVKTVLHLYRDKDDYETVKAFVEKDRTKIHKPGEILEDPSLIDWQVVIDKTANRKNFIVNNNLSKAINTEYEMAKKEAMKLDNDINGTEQNTGNGIQEIIKKIEDQLNSLSPVKKNEAKKKVGDSGLPTNYKQLKDVDVLNKILEAIGSI
jgi:hypothetical protein